MWTRTIPAEELTLWRESGQREYRGRIRRRGEVAWTNLSDAMGGDWLLGVRADINTPDQPAASFDLRLIRRAAEGTLSPGISAAPINQDAQSALRPLLHPGREVEVHARIKGGSYPWRLWLKGEVATAEWPDDEVLIRCRTMDGVLLRAQITEEVERGADDPGVPLATEIQGLLDGYWPGADVPVLRVIGDPELGIGRYKTPIGSLGAHIRTLAQRIGWDVRYLWSEPDQAYRLTLYLPPRDKTTPDFLLPIDEVADIPALSQSDEWVRNQIIVPYVTEVGGAEQRVVVEDAASIAEYRRQPMVVPISEGNEVPATAGQATAFGNYALHDLGRPLVEARYRHTRCLPWLELHDVIAVQADGARFDQDRIFSVVGGSHEVTADGEYTDLELRGGSPVGAVFAWWRFEGASEPAAILVEYASDDQGSNASDTFNPAIHTYARWSHDGGNTWTEWFKIVGEDGASSEGRYIDFIFRTSPDQPPTPVGEAPAGWFDAPPVYDPEATQLWMSRAERDGATGALLSTWSVPVPMTGARGPEGPQGPPGESAEVRYSGPQPGQNVSTSFDPQLHVYMQTRTTGEPWPTSWARIVGEAGQPGEDGRYTDYIFRVSATEPDTPTGMSPAGWHDAPPPHNPDAGEYLWMSSAERTEDGSLLTPWSDPVRLTGSQGPQGPQGPPGEDAHVPTPVSFGHVGRMPPTTVAPDLVNVVATIRDEDNRPGTLTAWVNHSSHDDPNPAGPADGSINLQPSDGFVTVTDANLWNLTGGGTGRLFRNLTISADQGKTITLEYVASDGETTGQQSFYLRSWNQIVDEALGEILPDSLKYSWQLAKEIRPPVVLPSLPTGNPDDLNWVYVDGLLYKWEGGAWQPLVNAEDLDGEIGEDQIADAAVTAEKIRDASVGLTKFASGMRPVEVVAALPTSGNVVGRTVVLTTDGKLYRYTSSGWTAAVPTADLEGEIGEDQIADAAVTAEKIRSGAVGLAKFATGIRPVEIVSSLPESGNTVGRTVVLTGDGKLYRYTSSGWSSAVPTGDLTGEITSTQIADDAITTPKIAANAVQAGHLDADSVTAGKIAAGAVGASEIAAGAVQAEHIRVGSRMLPLANPSVTGAADGWPLGVVGVTNRFGSTVTALESETDGNLLRFSEWIDIDPTKTYEVRASLRSIQGHSGATDGGILYFGLQAENASGTIIEVTPFDPAARAFGTPTDNPYFWSGGLGSGAWRDMVGYIIGANADAAEVRAGKNVTSHFRLPPTAQRIRLRWLNWSNGGVTRRAYLWSPTLTPVDATLIHGDGIVANSITTNKLAFEVVGSTNVVASINASTEGLRIQSDKITIDGSVQFGAGYDPTTKETPTGAQAKANAAQTAAINASLDKATYLTSGTTTIEGGTITTGSIAADQLAANSVVTGKIAAGAVKADEIDARAVGTEHLRIGSPALPLNNPSVTGSADGWPLGVVGVTNRHGTTVQALHIETNGNTQRFSEWLEVDPTRTYEVRASLRSIEGHSGETDGGVLYFGVQAQDANGNTLSVTRYDVATRQYTSSTTNGYFWSGGLGSAGWRDMVGYVLGENTPEEEVRQGKRVTNHIRIPANARRIRITWLNWSNGGTARSAYLWSPTITPVDSTLIHGDGIVTGSITTGKLAFTAVETGNVVAAINASSEGLRIQSDKITIDGSVQFGTGYDPTTKETPAGAQSKANAAQTAAINASLDKATYLSPSTTTIDGGKITTGSVEADQLAANSVIAGKIAAGAINTGSLFATGVVGATAIAANAVTADKISVTTLSEIIDPNGAPLGIVVSGLLRNAGDTIRLNLDATGAQDILRAPNVAIRANGTVSLGDHFSVDASGNATFAGTVAADAVVSATTFTAATALFSGDIFTNHGSVWVTAPDQGIRFTSPSEGARGLIRSGDTLITELLNLDISRDPLYGTFYANNSYLGPTITIGGVYHGKSVEIRSGDLSVHGHTNLFMYAHWNGIKRGHIRLNANRLLEWVEDP